MNLKRNLIFECLVLALLIFMVIVVVPFQKLYEMTAVAATQELLYSNDGEVFRGEGKPVDTSEKIYWDKYVVHKDYYVEQAPSYQVSDVSISNYCGPATGTNVIGFYDRFYSNLIPDFEPGALNSGDYWYFPDMGFKPIKNTFNELYNLMETNQHGAGTTGDEFKNGLGKYIKNHGYNLNIGSFYQNRTSVDLRKLTDMIEKNQVGVLLCTKYNFVHTISHSANETFLSKSDYTLAHMMMVYGYFTVDYYKNNQVFRSDTFLQISSGYATGEKGYILLNNKSMEIQEALIINIS